LNSLNGITKTNKNMENVLINKLELASELAHKQLINDYTNTFQIYEDENAGITNYSEVAQDIFNELYDEYLELIDSLTIKQ
jgi:hypothetical protein